jgi:hypothetical protein
MNVVIFGKGFGKPRQISLSGAGAGLAAFAVAALVMSAGFFGGYWYSSKTGSGVSTDELGELTQQIADQKETIEDIRQGSEDTLDALAIRIAQMNARMIRLDAVGRRLTEMADIDDGEFDFDSEPAMGGPEEPMAAGSVAAVPEVVEAMTALGYQLDNREAQLGVLESVLMNENLKERVYPQGRPVKSGWLSSYFGRRTDPFTGKPANHTGIDFAGRLTRYAHNSENLVAVGDEVRKGQVVALMGETGRATGPNLHFEVLQNGRRVNPVKFIRESSN